MGKKVFYDMVREGPLHMVRRFHACNRRSSKIVMREGYRYNTKCVICSLCMQLFSTAYTGCSISNVTVLCTRLWKTRVRWCQ